jgi:hypothetical protein
VLRERCPLRYAGAGIGPVLPSVDGVASVGVSTHRYPGRPIGMGGKIVTGVAENAAGHTASGMR